MNGQRYELFTDEEIDSILSNSLYAGYVLPFGKWTGNDVQNEELAIVSYEFWEQVQSKRSMGR